MGTTNIKWWLRENFALSHALAGVFAYVTVIILVNYDKPILEILELAGRQAFTTFWFTGLLVPRVQKRAVVNNIQLVVFWGVLVPSAIVAVASVSAHWYFTDEARNILWPFTTSIILNSVLVSARRAGHETLTSQILWFIRIFRG